MPVARFSQTVSEVLESLDDGDVRVSQVVAEVLVPYSAPSFTTVTGAGFSQVVAEVLMPFTDAQVRVSQVVAEVLMSSAGPGEGGATSGGHQTVSYGFVT